MVDLIGQYNKIKDEIDQAVIDVIRSSKYINGPEVKLFGEELEKYLGAKHVIPCANGTDALQVAMMALGLKPGDEVITASFTYVATAEVIALLGLTPILVDCDPVTFTLDPEQVEAAITGKTKAIVPVHLFGQCADMERIMQIAEKHNLYVIEDNAQAIGAEYTFSDNKKVKAGTIGTIGCTSFFPSKNLGCYGDGGAIFTNDDDIAAKIRMIANHGQRVRYYHDSIGVNSRLDSMQAAILRVKLRYFDSYLTARQQAAKYYNDAFADVAELTAPRTSSKSTHVYHQYTLITERINRDEMQKALAEKGIPSMIYYPVPLHMQKAYQSERYPEGSLPVTEQLCKSVISLPIHTELDAEQQDVIIDGVKSFIRTESGILN